MNEFTHILERVEQGDPNAAAELLPIVYEELRRLASQKMAHEAAGHTLQPTALVHEAWMRLGGNDAPVFQNRAHFFGAAAEAMRRILIEHARRRLAAKRGAGVEVVDFDGLDISSPVAADDQLLAVNDALEKLSVTIGASSGRAYGWNGGIDDIFVYNRALSPVEISELFQIPEPATSSLLALVTSAGLWIALRRKGSVRQRRRRKPE